MMRKRFLAVIVFMLMASPCYAMEYTIEAPANSLFGQPTSVATVAVTVEEPLNADRSKNAAMIPPAFGTATADLPGSGIYLTPNLVNEKENIQTVNNLGTGITIVPGLSQSTISENNENYNWWQQMNYTDITSDLYYIGGHIGRLSIPAIDLNVKVYEGTESTVLKKGAGHFEHTSIWDGNVAIAAHNRGVANHFGKIHTLSVGDQITFSTKLGVKKYHVFSVSKIHKDNVSVLNETHTDLITLITCVKNQPEYRWCVQGIAAE